MTENSHSMATMFTGTLLVIVHNLGSAEVTGQDKTLGWFAGEAFARHTGRPFEGHPRFYIELVRFSPDEKVLEVTLVDKDD